MKKILLTILLSVFALSTTACSMVYANPQYDYEETYAEDYAYLDDYALVDWGNNLYDIQYGYYGNDRVFLVIYGNRIYIIPYDYFYHYIVSRFRGRIIWRSYDWFCGYWGYNYYNNLWSHWYHRHYRSYWRPHTDYYVHHRNSGHNRPFVIRKNELRPRTDTRFRPRLNNTPTIRPKYGPNKPERQNFHYTPRSNRPQIKHQPYNSGIRRSMPTPPTVKHDNNRPERKKR